MVEVISLMALWQHVRMIHTHRCCLERVQSAIYERERERESGLVDINTANEACVSRAEMVQHFSGAE